MAKIVQLLNSDNLYALYDMGDHDIIFDKIVALALYDDGHIGAIRLDADGNFGDILNADGTFKESYIQLISEKQRSVTKAYSELNRDALFVKPLLDYYCHSGN